MPRWRIPRWRPGGHGKIHGWWHTPEIDIKYYPHTWAEVFCFSFSSLGLANFLSSLATGYLITSVAFIKPWGLQHFHHVGAMFWLKVVLSYFVARYLDALSELLCQIHALVLVGKPSLTNMLFFNWSHSICLRQIQCCTTWRILPRSMCSFGVGAKRTLVIEWLPSCIASLSHPSGSIVLNTECRPGNKPRDICILKFWYYNAPVILCRLILK